MGSCWSKPNKYGISRSNVDVYMTPFELPNSGRYETSENGGKDAQNVCHSNNLESRTCCVNQNPAYRSEDDVRFSSESIICSNGDTFLHESIISINDRANNIEHMVDAFRTLIEGSVKVMEIIPYIQCIGDTDTFRSKDKDSPKEAMSMLIDRLKASDQPGKWQSFIDALTQAEYPYIVHLLKGETQEDHTIARELLTLFTPHLIRRMDPKIFIDHLFEKKVINDSDMEEIRCELLQRGATAASFLILDRIPRRLENWYEEFVDVLRQCGFDDVIDHFQLLPARCGRGYLRHSGSGQFMTVPEWGSGTMVKQPYDHYQSAPPPSYDGQVNQVKKVWRPRSLSFGNSLKEGQPRFPSLLDTQNPKIAKLNKEKDKLQRKLQDKEQLQKLKKDINDLKKKLEDIDSDDDLDDSSMDELSEDNFIDARAATGACANFGLDIYTNRNQQGHTNVTHATNELHDIRIKLDEIMKVVSELKNNMHEFDDLLKTAYTLKQTILDKLADIDTKVNNELHIRLKNPPCPHVPYDQIYVSAVSADSAISFDESVPCYECGTRL